MIMIAKINNVSLIIIKNKLIKFVKLLKKIKIIFVLS